MEKINSRQPSYLVNTKLVSMIAIFITVAGILFSLDIIFPIEHVSRIDAVKEYLSFYSPPFLKGIKAIVTDERPENLNDLTLLQINAVYASSSLAGEDYIPEKMIDGNLKTAWQEGALSSEGVGESVKFKVDGRTVSTIGICSGFWINQKVYQKNNRPKMVRIKLGGGGFTVDLSDEMKEHYICFSKPLRMTDVEIMIKEVYQGSTGDCCITEISFYGERIPEN